MLLKGFNKTPAGVFIDSGVLEKFLPFCLIYKASGGNKFYIDLEALSRIAHLLIGLWNIFWVSRFLRHHALFAKETIKPGNGTFIASLHEFHPEDNQTGMRISASHIVNEFDLIGGMLVRVVVRSSGAVTQGIPGTIIPTHPAVNILPVGLIFDGRLGHTIFLSEAN